MGFNINFMGYRRPALVLSLVLCVISVGLLLFKGLNLGIDFTGDRKSTRLNSSHGS